VPGLRSCQGPGPGGGAGRAAGDYPGGSHAGAGRAARGGCRSAGWRVRREAGAGFADRGGDGAAVAGGHWGVGAAAVDQDLVEVAEDAGRPLRAAEFAVATGQSTEKAKVEGLRSKLKLLAARGWLAGVPGGLFTLEDSRRGNTETRAVRGSSF
jgi:hypothetical protein